jgi:hypothetical protein
MPIAPGGEQAAVPLITKHSNQHPIKNKYKRRGTGTEGRYSEEKKVNASEHLKFPFKQFLINANKKRQEENSNQSCNFQGKGPVLRIRNWIGSGFNFVRGSGSRHANLVPKLSSRRVTL